MAEGEPERAEDFDARDSAPGGDNADLSDLFEGLFGGGGQPRGGGSVGLAALAAEQNDRRPRRGPTSATGLRALCRRSVLKEQRVNLGNGKTIEIKLPKGVEEGTKVRLAGQGEPGSAGAGDAIVTIHISPHRFFTRDGTISGSICRSRWTKRS
jgi:DnaJ-class molecular chaperone